MNVSDLSFKYKEIVVGGFMSTRGHLPPRRVCFIYPFRAKFSKQSSKSIGVLGGSGHWSGVIRVQTFVYYAHICGRQWEHSGITYEFNRHWPDRYHSFLGGKSLEFNRNIRSLVSVRINYNRDERIMPLAKCLFVFCVIAMLSGYRSNVEFI